jgi:hypothetical protein
MYAQGLVRGADEQESANTAVRGMLLQCLTAVRLWSYFYAHTSVWSAGD